MVGGEPEVAGDGGVAHVAEEAAVAADLRGVSGVLFAEFIVYDGDSSVGGDDDPVRAVKFSSGVDDAGFIKHY